MRPNREFLLKHPAHMIAFGFGTGLMPKAPGTWGTLVGVPIYLISNHFGGFLAALAAALALFVIGIWASSIAGKALGVA
ncbi:MAG: phosphatidylglycerophosphatase A, partial [Burkholderiales bacterium]|nr:phosphatidylglycerophosphatase A [Burkholderiales bacterium]